MGYFGVFFCNVSSAVLNFVGNFSNCFLIQSERNKTERNVSILLRWTVILLLLFFFFMEKWTKSVVLSGKQRVCIMTWQSIIVIVISSKRKKKKQTASRCFWKLVNDRTTTSRREPPRTSVPREHRVRCVFNTIIVIFMVSRFIIKKEGWQLYEVPNAVRRVTKPLRVSVTLWDLEFSFIVLTDGLRILMILF